MNLPSNFEFENEEFQLRLNRFNFDQDNMEEFMDEFENFSREKKENDLNRLMNKVPTDNFRFNLKYILLSLAFPEILFAALGIAAGLLFPIYKFIIWKVGAIAPIINSMYSLSDMFAPLSLIILGITIGRKGIRIYHGMKIRMIHVVCVCIIKNLIIPGIGIGYICAIKSIHFSLFIDNKPLCLVLFLFWAAPTDIFLLFIYSEAKSFEDELSVILFWVNATGLITLYIWIIIYFRCFP